MKRVVSDCLASGLQNSSSHVTPINLTKYHPEMYSNSHITVDPEEGYFCAQNADDMKLLQILRYIKTCDGALDLLWTFLLEHDELRFPLKVNVSRDTVEQENRGKEESRILDTEMISINEEQSAQSQDRQFFEYSDVKLEVDYERTTGVKHHIGNRFGEQSVAILGEDRKKYSVHNLAKEHTLMSVEVKEQIAEVGDYESESTVACSGFEINTFREVEDRMGDSTLAHNDIGGNSHEEGEYGMGEKNLEVVEVNEEISKLHNTESDSTVAHNDIEDNPYGEGEDSMGENGPEVAEIKEEISHLHDIESVSAVAHSDTEDNPHEGGEDGMNEKNLEVAEVEEEISDLVDIELVSTVAHSNVEEHDKSEDGMNEKNMEFAEVKEEILECFDNIIDFAQLNTNENETPRGKFEGEERKETAKQGCPVWEILRRLECPFVWVPDIFIRRTINSTVQENMIDHLTEKEKEFSQVKSSIFREVAIYLVLAYEKTMEDNFMEAIADLHHCYTLLDNSEILTWCAETEIEELDITLVRGQYHFSEMKCKRKCLMYDIDETATGKNLPVKDGDNEGEVLNTSRPPKHIAREESASPAAELICSDIQAVYEVAEAKKTTDSEECCEDGGTVGLSAECILMVTNSEVKNHEIESYLKEKKYLNVTDFQSDKAVHEVGIMGSLAEDLFEKASVDVQNKWILQQHETADRAVCEKISDTEKDESGIVCDTKNDSHEGDIILVSEGSKKRNQDALNNNNNNLQADIIQKSEFDNTTQDSENEKPVREDNEPEKQAQRMAAIEYVLNATLAYVAYFSGSSQEAYKLAKHIEHIYERLGRAGKATVAALRGAMLLEYGYTGNKLSLQFLQKALELDPECWEWNLYCGKVMSRVRQVEKFRGQPGQEEVGLFEKAVQLNPGNASALVQLANAYRALSYFRHKQNLNFQPKGGSVIETRNYVRYGGAANWKENWSKSRHSQQQEELEPLKNWYSLQHRVLPHADTPLDTDQKDYLQLAKELFLKALEIEPQCPYTNARCAKALWAMPVPYKDKKRAQQAILHALALAPESSFVNHYAAIFFEYCHDYEKALACYEMAIHEPNLNYPAEMSYINLKMKISPPGSYSPLFHFDELLSKYYSHNYVVQILCNRAFYLYKVEKHYLQAIQDISTAIRIDPACQTLKTFYPGNFYGRDTSYNMYDLLEETALQYRELHEGLADKDFIEETVKTVRHLKDNSYALN